VSLKTHVASIQEIGGDNDKCECICTVLVLMYSSHPDFSMKQQSILAQGPLIIQASLSVRHTTLDRSLQDERSARRRHIYLTFTMLKTDTHDAGRIRIRNPSKLAAAVPLFRLPYRRLRPKSRYLHCVISSCVPCLGHADTRC